MDQEERAQQVYTPLRLTGRQLQWAGAAVAVLTIAILIGYPFGITLWDWMKLLVVPVVIAAGGLWFNQQQQYRQLALQDQHAQDAALQAYLDQLTQLLVTEKDDELIKMRVEDDVRQVIQARSEPLLRSVDSTRRWSVILFLAVMGLLTRDRPLVSLARADLEGVDGHDAPLQGIDLGQANLSGADLSGANLSGANLREADLREANLTRANLIKANLFMSNLVRADLSRAELMEANLRGTHLIEANLRGAMLSDATQVEVRGGPNDTDLTEVEYLRAADFSGANLRKANLSGAYLGGVDLRGADLTGADLSEARLGAVEWDTGYYLPRGADLREANLSGVAGITNEELERQAYSLEGATMPHGQKYEDWLKDREVRKEDASPS